MFERNLRAKYFGLRKFRDLIVFDLKLIDRRNAFVKAHKIVPEALCLLGDVWDEISQITMHFFKDQCTFPLR